MTNRRAAAAGEAQLTRRDEAPTLATEISVRRRFWRSTNVERHGDAAFASEYIPTSRGLEVVRRVAAATQASSSGRAWSLTGPYGAGKSSFALFLASLLGPRTDPQTVAATDVLARADPLLQELVSAGRRSLG